MVPRGDLLDTIGLWSAMCFAFSGFEITSLIGQEIRDPERTIPRGIFIAGAATTVDLHRGLGVGAGRGAGRRR